MKDRLAVYGLDKPFGPDAFYSTIGSVVSSYVEATGARWTDWTDPDRTADEPAGS
ncbi:hypothetical protein HC251_18680 [Iamia sp. SCSIO 61187]|uniref:hypothetical protein n=1 Tax=Iamia sp. SCSIO 61187 TaxID=2722752 RepID=UPI001C6287F5|nr:hypothetical protein [Iamia sp. SCSIO 61187]QYG94262.1 hypothetical protein HC251_18680 [Iamia sp. SCSIO 61187]